MNEARKIRALVVDDEPLARRRILKMLARDGRTYDAKVQTSSGFPKLDQMAVDTAMTSWRFKPGTVDDMPAAMWFPFAFRFTLPADAAKADKK